MLFTILLFSWVQKGYGQRVYGTNYGYRQSGTAIPLVISAGLVDNPSNALGANMTTNFTRLFVGGLLGSAYAEYQIKFITGTGNLPKGTSVFVKIDGNINPGLLNLLLASQGFVSAQKNATSVNEALLSGESVSFNIQSTTIDGSQYLQITPTDCFNSVRFSITTAGLLGLLSSAELRIYHAFYDLPSAISIDDKEVCGSQAVTLNINNPIASSGCDYQWYSQATGGTALATGPSFTTPTLTQTTSYYIGYSGISATNQARTPVTVTIYNFPVAPTVPPISVCTGVASTVSVSDPIGGITYRWYTDNDPESTAIATGTTFNIANPMNTTTYYVDAINSNDCVSTTRTAVTVTVIPKPPAPNIALHPNSQY